MLSLHSRISNNLNQYAKKANETGNIYRDDIAELKKMHSEQTKFLEKALDAVIMLNSDYCTGEEKFTFFRLPKCLVDNVCFAELSGDAKLLYAFFLDRVSLSKKWMD